MLRDRNAECQGMEMPGSLAVFVRRRPNVPGKVPVCVAVDGLTRRGLTFRPAKSLISCARVSGSPSVDRTEKWDCD